MEEYIGLDVSMKETAVSIRRNGKRIWRGRCASDPAVIATLLRKHAPSAKRVIFETGPLSIWFYHALCAEGLPAICIDARHAKAVLDMAANKTRWCVPANLNAVQLVTREAMLPAGCFGIGSDGRCSCRPACRHSP